MILNNYNSIDIVLKIVFNFYEIFSTFFLSFFLSFFFLVKHLPFDCIYIHIEILHTQSLLE